MSSAFAVEVRGIARTYGARTVLSVGDLRLSSGRAYALIGPNGSGKSTLLRILAGTVEASAGSIDVSGGKSRDEAAVGYMPQSSFIFDFSVRRNVELALEGSGLGREERIARVDEALEAVGMRDFADARGGGLSGGEAQRVALARILVRDLDIVLLDEPTASMDMAATMLAEEALVRYRARTDCLLLFATHAPAQARRIADEAIMLCDGCVVEKGQVRDVLDNPHSNQGKTFLAHWRV